MDEELARIHARLCGDGSVTVYETSEPDRTYRGVIQYTNRDDNNLNEFRQDMNTVFNVSMTRQNDTIRVKSLRIIETLEEQFGSVSTQKWHIPPEIMKSSTNIKYAWLRAFIRDEGYYEERYNRLRIKSMNKNGLHDMVQLMQSLNIKTSLTGPNIDNSYYLTVPSLDSYKKLLKIAKSKKKVRK